MNRPQLQDVAPAYQVLPALTAEYAQDSAQTEMKFYQFITYHESVQQHASANLYRCALVQLRSGLGAGHLGIMYPRPGESYVDADKRLREEAGI